MSPLLWGVSVRVLSRIVLPALGQGLDLFPVEFIPGQGPAVPVSGHLVVADGRYAVGLRVPWSLRGAGLVPLGVGLVA